MKENEVFLIDANIMIEPCNRYYAFDLVPAFWEELAPHFESGEIVLLDLVRKEILNDELTEWLGRLKHLQICNHVEASIVAHYQSVMNYIVNSGIYKASAYDKWAQSNVADPWLIAAAISNHYTLVTMEVPLRGISKKNQGKTAKLPNIAEVFDVKWIDLFTMMRRLGICIRGM